MRHQLKSKTPSAAARLRYITRVGSYAVGLDGPRMDLRATGNANLPIWAAGDATEFWSAADAFERANARRCLELELGLPRELTLEQQIAAVRDYIARLPIEMPMSWAIHDAGDGNPHVHLMIQERPLDDHARTAETWFKRANRQHPEKGGAIKSTWWHDRENVFYSRALWADACNVALINGGHEARFDARRKSVRLDEALRAGDLRAAALLTTLTEQHEGHAVAGMRRRWERLEVELDELPDYAQQIIVHNDRVRAHNNQVRDWARTASEIALRAYLSAELAELREQLATENPGAHVGAWIAHAHNLDRQRGVALAVEAGELELRSLAQIEASERAARAAAELADAAAALVELDALVADEQADLLDGLLSIEREQAHSAALVEGAQRERTAIAAELGALVSSEALDVTRQRLAIEREQAHSAALAEEAGRGRRATALHAMERWADYLRGRPEADQAVAMAARVRAGEPGVVDQAEQLARSWNAAERAEKARQEALETQRIEQQRQAAERAERAERERQEAQQRRAEQVRLAAIEAERAEQARQAAERETRAPEPRVGSFEWVEFEEGGERYRHPAGRPDEIYWQNPSGEWHLQPGAGESEPDDYETGYDYR